MAKKQKTPVVAEETAEQQTQSPKQRPVYEIKLPFNGGLLKGAIWQHQSDQGKPWFTLSLSRAHRDADSGKWSYGGNSFTRDELLGLVRVIEVAHGRMVKGNFTGGQTNE